MSASTLPLGLVFRLALAVVLDTAVHIVWKLAVLQLPNPGSLSASIEAACREPLFLFVAALFVWQLVNWLRVLKGCDLSYSQPITALSLILVLVLSALYLGESVDALKVLGIGLVFAGVWFISRTEHDSSARSAIRR
jgi:drug/metabolite transporter (DMT)-like permease